MWKIVLRSTGQVLASGFPSLADADKWHDTWLDQQDISTEYPAVDFLPETPVAGHSSQDTCFS